MSRAGICVPFLVLADPFSRYLSWHFQLYLIKVWEWHREEQGRQSHPSSHVVGVEIGACPSIRAVFVSLGSEPGTSSFSQALGKRLLQADRVNMDKVLQALSKLMGDKENGCQVTSPHP